MMMEAALKHNGPAVIRYPKGNSGRPDGDPAPAPIEWGKAAVVREGSDLSFWCAGREIYTAMAAADILETKHGLRAAVVPGRDDPAVMLLPRPLVLRVPILVFLLALRPLCKKRGSGSASNSSSSPVRGCLKPTR